MYVKALRLAGFKSFADPTVLEFDRAVSVIVGPNGSGKSNIADALSWVLGSQAPSTLRGATMEDVIFAGSESRPRQAMAEVELTLDNSSGVLPLDLSEVTISRFTDRAGTSEYRINGAPCRLLDITELLSDTGIGRSIHTVVGQGQLDEILGARPEDRRAFIEEAAQIGKHRRRKDRALRKIERVDDNLVRLNDVVTELRRAIRPLKRQAGAAAAYSELMAEQRDLKQRLAGTELHRLAATGAKVDPEAEQRRAALLGEELASLRARLADAVTDREDLAARAEDAQRRAYRMGRAADRLWSIGRLAGERAATIAARLEAETEQGYRERIRLLSSELDRWGRAAAELTEGLTQAQQKAAARRGELDVARGSLDIAQQELSRARAQETAAAEALVRAEGHEAAGRATLGSIEARVRSIVERREVMAGELGKDAARITTAEREVRALETELDAATEAAALAETRLEEARERAEVLKTQLADAHGQFAAAEARVETLATVVRLLTDVPQAVERLKPLQEDARARFDLAHSGERDAAAVLADVQGQAEERWREVARHDEELRRLDALMSGAAERLASARRNHETHEIELSVLDEELARNRDALAEAETAATEARAGLPARRAAMEDARRARESAEKGVGAASSTVATATDELAVLELESRGVQERALAARLRVEEAQAGIADAEAALSGLAEIRAGLNVSLERVERAARIARFAARRGRGWVATADAHAEEARRAAFEADRHLESMRARERELADRLEEVSRRRSEAQVRRAETKARTDAIAERAMEEWGLSPDALMALEVFADEDEPGARERAEKLERDMRRLGAVNPRAAEEYQELAERERFLIEQMEDLRSSRRDLMKIVRDVDATIVDVFGRAFEDVAGEFEQVFGRLFPGGSGRLKLTEPDDLLSTGIEVEARPPGKNVKKLSLLSGGERSLVALAFLLAIFRSRPSPFYLLDEVEAALDDVNLHRFLTLIGELEQRAQVLIVTHQKRTMEAADVLYGVTMGPDGASRVVAKQMEDVTL